MAYTGAIPDTAARRLDWQDSALCRTGDPDVFFDGPEREAKRTCFACPVLLDCQSWVMGRERGMTLYQRDDAVVAGLTAKERLDLDPAAPKAPAEAGQRKPRAKRRLPQHGERAKYKAGCRCDPCKAANRQYSQDLKRRKESGEKPPPKPADVPPCGTSRGYKRHVRHGEPIDEPCRQAHAQKRAVNKARKRERDVYELWVKGLPDGEIAAQLGIGPRGVRLVRERRGLIENIRTNGRL
ncbi:WhiB family transcriptional regulator [Streptomyces sp. BB1-1-1]|uniref:WhiB family transcriptional regulator n=1 Tax=Streptomyces sp. BB1-1-1 TaxID=3074430 RepID=UPI002877CE60|nr:WhiB family transcriptional regulator [Streptomyces sp. BB1-1-1]WND34002.1 WhiB family transcriptional regulator [Streptomyces sp. BB1-1-1]